VKARLLIFLLAPTIVQIAQGGVKELTLRWEEVGAAVGKQVVTVELIRNTRLKGTIIGVGQDAIRMNIQSSSDKQTFPPGEGSVPRKEIAAIRIKRMEGRGRLIGAAGIGSAASLGSLRWAISESRVNVSDNKRIAQWAAISAAAVAGGYWIGRLIDSKETVIKIAPEVGR
jgi:hypothetical protein